MKKTTLIAIVAVVAVLVVVIGIAAGMNSGSNPHINDPSHEHKESGWIVEKRPTATEDGRRYTKCIFCGQVMNEEVLLATGSVGLAYEVNSDGETCTVTGIGTCTDKDVVIPSTIDDYTVTELAFKAFSEQTELTSIRLPETLKKIGDRAFYGCTGLTEMTIPESVLSIGTQIFYKAENLSTVNYYSSYYSKDNPFLNLPHITKVVFDGKAVLGKEYYRSYPFKEVVIGDDIANIGRFAFYRCNSLESVTIGKGINSIEMEAFDLCKSLKHVYYNGDIEGWCNIEFEEEPQFDSYASNPLLCGSNLYIDNKLVTELVIPDTVRTINDGAFYGCDSLTSVILPDSITGIGRYAFAGCSSLISITVPDSVTSIGYEAIHAREVINKSTLRIEAEHLITDESESFVRCVGDYVFYDTGSEITLIKYVGNDSEITLPIYDGSEEYGIDDYAFWNNDTITSITITCNLSGELYAGQYSVFAQCASLTNITIADSVTKIPESAFDGCVLIEYYEYNDALYLGNKENPYHTLIAVKDKSIVNYEVNSNTKIIYDEAFYGCESLTSVIIPNSVTTINEGAFRRCSSLETITIPDSVTYIGGYVFQLCNSLKSVILENTSGWWWRHANLTPEKIPSADISNPATAASYFISYEYKYWVRME